MRKRTSIWVGIWVGRVAHFFTEHSYALVRSPLRKNEDLNNRSACIRDRGRPDDVHSIQQMSTGPVKWPLGDVCPRERFRLNRKK